MARHSLIYMNPRHQKGAINELKAQEWFLSQGYYVFTPLVQQGVVDFVVQKDLKLETVQVKTAHYVHSSGHDYLTCRLGRSTGTRLKQSHTAYRAEDKFDILFVIYEENYWLVRDLPDRKTLYFNLSNSSRTPYNPNDWIVQQHQH